MVYDFRFLDDLQATRSADAFWFKVPDILGMKNGPAMLESLMAHQLVGDDLQRAYKAVDRLHQVIHTEPTPVHYYEEEAQDVEQSTKHLHSPELRRYRSLRTLIFF